MPEIVTEIESLARVQRDGSISRENTAQIAEHINAGEIVVMPVDFIYGIIVRYEPAMLKILDESGLCDGTEADILISSYRMLETMASISKTQFDFLHRIWPGEVSAYFEKDETYPYRMPVSPWVQEVLAAVEVPLLFMPCMTSRGGYLYRREQLLKRFKGEVHFLFIIGELCRQHIAPSRIDISHDDIRIIREGRIDGEELKSLYYLDSGSPDE